jgi:hypothetical protein
MIRRTELGIRERRLKALSGNSVSLNQIIRQMGDRFPGVDFENKGNMVTWVNGPTMVSVSGSLNDMELARPIGLQRIFTRDVFQRAIKEVCDKVGINNVPTLPGNNTFRSPFVKEINDPFVEKGTTAMEMAWQGLETTDMSPRKDPEDVAKDIYKVLDGIYGPLKFSVNVTRGQIEVNRKPDTKKRIEPERPLAELRKIQKNEYPGDDDTQIIFEGKEVGTPPLIYVEATKAAKMLREELHDNFPDNKFSVRTKKYAGGSSIGVEWEDGPSAKDVEGFSWKYHGANLDGQRDVKEAKVSQIKNPDGTITMAQMESDFVFTRRKYSPGVFKEALESVCEDHGLDVPKVKVMKSLGPVVDPTDDREVGPGLMLSHLVDRCLSERSF